MATASAKVREISHLVSKLNDEDQQALLSALKSQILMAEAKYLDDAVKSNNVSIGEVVAIVREVRQTRSTDNAI